MSDSSNSTGTNRLTPEEGVRLNLFIVEQVRRGIPDKLIRDMLAYTPPFDLRGMSSSSIRERVKRQSSLVEPLEQVGPDQQSSLVLTGKLNCLADTEKLYNLCLADKNTAGCIRLIDMRIKILAQLDDVSPAVPPVPSGKSPDKDEESTPDTENEGGDFGGDLNLLRESMQAEIAAAEEAAAELDGPVVPSEINPLVVVSEEDALKLEGDSK